MIYLYNENGELLREFDNIIAWSSNFVEFMNGAGRCKIYCSEGEYFTDKKIEVEDGKSEENS